MQLRPGGNRPSFMVKKKRIILINTHCACHFLNGASNCPGVYIISYNTFFNKTRNQKDVNYHLLQVLGMQ